MRKAHSKAEDGPRRGRHQTLGELDPAYQTVNYQRLNARPSSNIQEAELERMARLFQTTAPCGGGCRIIRKSLGGE